MAHIKDVEAFMHNMLASMADESRQEAKEFGQQAGWVAAELDHWRQRCEELEIELECMRNAFPEHDNDILPKERGIF
jgi:hypothetical protein